MGQPAAKQGDRITATDMHLITQGTSTVSAPHPFSGILQNALSADVKILGRAAATVDSVALNTPPHIPSGGSFVSPPANRGRVARGSATVRINGKAAARNGDPAFTCNDPVDQMVGSVVATGTVSIGG